MTNATQSSKAFPGSHASAPANAISGLVVKLLDWQDKVVQRRRLKHLDERILSDIGISRRDAEQEARKPAWRN